MNINQINEIQENAGDIDLAVLIKEEKSYTQSVKQTGLKRSPEARANLGKHRKGIKLSDEHKAKLLAPHLGSKASNETKRKMSIAAKNRVLEPKYACNVCGRLAIQRNIDKWHNDNCKHKS